MFLQMQSFNPTEKKITLWNDNENDALNSNEHYIGVYWKVHDHKLGKSMCA